MRSNDWLNKFEVAWRGIRTAFRTQSSMRVHRLVSVIVVGMAIVLRLDPFSFAVLLLAVGTVIAAEIFNTAIEELVRVIHPSRDKRIGLVLDMAAGAVLVLSITAALVGVMILGPPLLRAF